VYYLEDYLMTTEEMYDLMRCNDIKETKVKRGGCFKVLSRQPD
jgi:hypothetical protein